MSASLPKCEKFCRCAPNFHTTTAPGAFALFSDDTRALPAETPRPQMPADRLKQILEVKEREVARILPRLDLLRAAALQRNDFRPFAAALDRGPEALGLIAEVKKASPSAGVIAADFDPVAIAQQYEAAGAHCVSVLTDEQFFQGHLSYLTKIRQTIALPCLRKDFIIHDAQIYEAAVAGADAILLIVAALTQGQLASSTAAARRSSSARASCAPATSRRRRRNF
jgi:hypothetical protein